MSNGLPYSAEAESALIAALIQYPSLTGTVALTVEPEEFFDPVKGFLYGVLRTRWEASEPVDAIILKDDIRHAGLALDEEALDALFHRSVEAAHLVEYAKIVFRDAMRRRMIETSQASHEAALESADHAGVLDYTYGLLAQIEEREAKAATRSLDDLASAVEADWLNRAERVGYLGWPTGIDRYDRWTDGIRQGHMHVITGYTNVGKSQFLVEQTNGLLNGSARVSIFSMEMSEEQVFTRLVANRANVDSRIVEHGRWTHEQKYAIQEAVRKLRTLPLRIYDAAFSPLEIQRKLRTDGADVGLVDYFQRLAGVSGSYEGAARAAHEVYNIPKKNHCGLVVFSQISAEVEKQQGEGDIKTKNGNELAENADAAFLLYRDKVATPNQLDVKIKKNRHGPSGFTASYHIDLATGRLTEMRG